MTFDDWWWNEADWNRFKQLEDAVTYNIIYQLCKDSWEKGNENE